MNIGMRIKQMQIPRWIIPAAATTAIITGVLGKVPPAGWLYLTFIVIWIAMAELLLALILTIDDLLQD